MPLRIERMRYGGAGVAVDDAGNEIALPFTLPGELVEIATADSTRVISASKQRVAPGCRHFGACGGCQYQHASYPEQILIKHGILFGLLKASGMEVPEIEIRSSEPWEYRNRIRLRVQTIEGQTKVGYSRRSTNEFLPVVECPIAAPLLWRTVEAVLEAGEKDRIWRRWLEHLSEMELFCSADESRVQISFFLRDADVARNESFTDLCEKLKTRLPELTGAGAGMDADLGRRKRKSWDGAAWGSAGLAYEAAGLKYWVTRGAFFQVNRFLVDEMVKLATQGATGVLAWDLFAGVGLFSRALAAHFTQVVAVESSPVAAADLARIGKNIRAVEGATLEFLRRAIIERDRPELIVMDPPRAGVGSEACALLGRIAPARIVYVSCDPVTLARDLAVLTRAGYKVEKIWMVDMFPQTFHLETVVSLRRQAV